MGLTNRGIPGSGIRDGSLTPLDFALINWQFTAPMTSGVLTGPPTAATGTMTIDGNNYTATMTISRDGNNVPTSIVVTYPGIDGESNATITYTPVYDNNGNLIGESAAVTA